MHKTLIILSIVFLGCLFALWDMVAPPPQIPYTPPPHDAHKVAPDVTLTTPSGEEIKLHDLKGKPILLNIWATWCPPCIKEMPDLLKLAHRHKNEMVFIALSTDRDTQTVEQFFSRLPEDIQPLITKENVIFAHDPQLEISKGAFETTMYPESFIINKDMIIVKKIEGVTNWLGEDVRYYLFGE